MTDGGLTDGDLTDGGASAGVPDGLADPVASAELEVIGLDEAEAGLVSDLSQDRDSRLGNRAARGVVVTLAGQGTQLALQMISVIVLARLLTPHDYGLYAIGVVIVGVGEIFRDFGLSSAAIQARILTVGQRNNLFWLNTGLGFVLMMLLFAAAPLVGWGFDDDALVSITRVLSVTFLINGIATQFRAGLNRQMRFGVLAASDLCGQVLGVSTAVVAAALGAHYWALVGSQLAQFGTTLIILVLAARWLPGRPDRSASVRGFLRFGWPFLATQIVNYASGNIDKITIGMRLGPASLGIYSRAAQLLMTPLNQVRTPATTVALPVLSRLQDDYERAGRYLRRGQITLGYTIVVALAFVVATAQPLVGLLLGTEWRQVAPILALFAIGGVFQFLSFVGYWAYISRGLTAQLFRYTLISLSINATCILIGSNWGLIGVAVGDTVAPALAWPVSLWWLSRSTVIPVAEFYYGAFRILSMATASAAAGFLACRSLAGVGDVVQILAGGGACLAVYAVGGALVPAIRRDLVDTADLIRRVAR